MSRSKTSVVTRRTAEKLGMSYEEVDKIVDLYYKQLIKKMKSCDYIAIRVTGLGTFYPYMPKVKAYLTVNEQRIENVDELSLNFKERQSYETSLKNIESYKKLLALSKKHYDELQARRQNLGRAKKHFKWAEKLDF